MPTRIIQRTPDLGFTIKMKRTQPEPEAEAVPVEIDFSRTYHNGFNLERSLYIKPDGTLWAVGSDWHRVRGPYPEPPINFLPAQQIGADSDWVEVFKNTTFDDIFHVLKKDGTLWFFGGVSGGGWYDSGAGIGVEGWPLPVQVGTDKWLKAYSGEGSSGQSMGIKADGTLWVWGNKIYIDCSYGDTKPVWNGFTRLEFPRQVGTDTDWADMANLPGSVVIEKKDGTLWGVGENKPHSYSVPRLDPESDSYSICQPFLLDFPGNVPRA
jgi:hypothetical protein